MKSCYLCGSGSFNRVEGKVRDRPELGILKCSHCGLVCLENFDHVHDEYYESDYTVENHPAQQWRDYISECRVDDERRLSQILPLVTARGYLDVGCGAGGILIKARPYCRIVAGVEPQSRWRNELRNEGFNIYASIGEVPDQGHDVISLFHVLEHVPEPLPFLAKVARKATNGGVLIIEVPSADDALLQLYRCKAFSEFTYWSPHLFLYNLHTLRLLLSKAGLADRITIQQVQRYPLSNHLMWLAMGKPGGHQTWSFLDTPALTAAYTAQLGSPGMCDTLIAMVQLGRPQCALQRPVSGRSGKQPGLRLPARGLQSHSAGPTGKT